MQYSIPRTTAFELNFSKDLTDFLSYVNPQYLHWTDDEMCYLECSQLDSLEEDDLHYILSFSRHNIDFQIEVRDDDGYKDQWNFELIGGQVEQVELGKSIKSMPMQ